VNVCLVNHASYAALADVEGAQIGGEEVQHALLARTLAARGHDVSLVSCDFGQLDGAVVDGVVVHPTFKPKAGIPFLRFFHPRWTRLERALRRSNASIFYVSGTGVAVGQVAAFARRHGKRLVFRVASDSDCEPKKLLVNNPRDRFLHSYGLRRCHRIAVQTEHQRQLMKANYGLDSEIVPMLVDVPAAVRSREDRDIDVLWVANLLALKRPGMFVRLAAAHPGLRFSLVGGEAQGNSTTADQVIEEARGVPNLTLHGRKPYREVLKLFERARLFVNTSSLEGFPNTFLQAWAQGAPTISFFDPDSHIAKYGLGRQVRDLDDMSRAICVYESSPAEWSNASSRCRAYMRTRYAAGTQPLAYERLFGQVEQRT